MRVKSSVLWDLRAFSQLKIKKRFRATCRLYLTTEGTDQGKDQYEAGRQRTLTVY